MSTEREDKAIILAVDLAKDAENAMPGSEVPFIVGVVRKDDGKTTSFVIENPTSPNPQVND